MCYDHHHVICTQYLILNQGQRQSNGLYPSQISLFDDFECVWYFGFLFWRCLCPLSRPYIVRPETAVFWGEKKGERGKCRKIRFWPIPRSLSGNMDVEGPPARWASRFSGLNSFYRMITYSARISCGNQRNKWTKSTSSNGQCIWILIVFNILSVCSYLCVLMMCDVGFAFVLCQVWHCLIRVVFSGQSSLKTSENSMASLLRIVTADSSPVCRLWSRNV